MESVTAPAPTPRAQFSLRTIFLVCGAMCLLLAPMHWFGTSYMVSAIFSVVLVGACVAAYYVSRPASVSIALFAAILGFPIALAALVFLFHAIVNLVVCIVLAAVNLRPRYVAYALVGAMFAVYGFMFLNGATAIREIRRLQAEYPFASVADRLAFEKPAVDENGTTSDLQLSKGVMVALDKQDQLEPDFYARSHALRDLHEDYQREFARAAGFGFMRMPSLQYRLIYMNAPEPLSLPVSIRLAQAPSTNQDLVAAHHLAAADFVSVNRIGYVKNKDEVAGFESHRFTGLRHELDSNNYSSQPLYWQVVRLELVGVLRNSPRVYTSDAPPPLDQLDDAPHRPLNDFETSALSQLATQQDLVVNKQTDKIEMVGALRAGTSCIACHEGSRGKLLGALSYEIQPIAGNTPTAAAGKVTTSVDTP